MNIRELFKENGVYSSTALAKKMKMLADYTISNNKTYDLTSEEPADIIDMLNIILATSKGDSKRKILLLLSEYGYEINTASISPITNKTTLLVDDPKIQTRITNIDSDRNSEYDVVELLKEIDELAQAKLNKKQLAAKKKKG
jgi:hypothetical protein